MNVPWHHSLHLASAQSYPYTQPQLRNQGQAEIQDQLLAREGPRTAARDICHRGGQKRARLKVSPLPRRLELRAGSRPGSGKGTSQESRTMAETCHTSCSGGRLRASRECQNITAEGQGAPGCSALTPGRDWLGTYLVGVCQNRGCLTRCCTLERPP